MKKVMIIGAGGHASVVIDILQCAQKSGAKFKVGGFLDDNKDLHGNKIYGVRVMGAVSELAKIPHDAVIVAIGDNQTRTDIYNRLQKRGEDFFTTIHPSTILATDVKIGSGAVICAGVVVNPGSLIGNNVILNTACAIDHHNHIGDHVHVAPGAHTGGNVKLESGVLIGMGSAILPENEVGAWSTVGAGAVVHKNLPDHVVAVGIPARVIEKYSLNYRLHRNIELHEVEASLDT